MSMDDIKKGWNTNSSISIGLVIIIIGATFWLNNSLGDLKTGQLVQEKSMASMSGMVQIKIDAISARIDAMGARIDGLVTRPELEARVSELRLEQSKLELQLLRQSAADNRTAK